MIQLAPSILSANFNHLGDDIKKVENSQTEILHIDVMDGAFVPSISFGMPVIASIRKETSLFFDVHLMVEEPIRYLEEFVKAGADGITVHQEACSDLEGTLKKIKELGVKAAVSINPETKVSAIEEVLDQVDMVLVMSVHPGFGGQKLIPETLDKIKELKVLRESKKLCYTIEVDGGINCENLKEVAECGADILVAGTAVFQGEIEKNIMYLKGVIPGAS